MFWYIKIKKNKKKIFKKKLNKKKKKVKHSLFNGILRKKHTSHGKECYFIT